jgi:GTPase Era involved in 16S rRNA processing
MAKVSSRKKVLIHPSHQQSDASMRIAADELAQKNMLVSAWTTRDYGIDGMIEVASPFEKELISMAQFFLVQLKSVKKMEQNKTGYVYSVKTIHLLQWIASNNHVMLMVVCVPDKKTYWTWIDSVLLAKLEARNSDWASQSNIRIPIPFENDFNILPAQEVWQYIKKNKKASKLDAGLFFNLSERSTALLAKTIETTKQFEFSSINEATTSLQQEFQQAIYRVAITGPSRAGKSTLINAFLKRKEISPTDIYQTTGVPIQILPSETEYLKIFFKDGTSNELKLTTPNIKAYVTQQLNDQNRKQVRLATIHIRNAELEKGISFFDVPGLDDADDEIVDYAWAAVIQSNAVLYVIDASPFANGGFVFRKDFKTQLTQLSTSLDKIFLVFNKINVLNAEALKLLQNYVLSILQKHGLKDHIEDRIYYISATEVNAESTKTVDAGGQFTQLKDDLWNFIITENKSGLTKLHMLSKQLERVQLNFRDLLNTRLLDDEGRKKVIIELQKIQSQVRILKPLMQGKLLNIKRDIPIRLNQIMQIKLNRLEQELKTVDLNQKLPDKTWLKLYLTQSCNETFEEMNAWIIAELISAKTYLDQWIRDNLSGVHNIIEKNSEGRIVYLTELELVEVPEPDYSTAIKTAIATGVIAFFINPAAGALAGLAGFFADLLMTQAERREKQIHKTVDKARERMKAQFNTIAAVYNDYIGEAFTKFAEYARTNIEHYTADLKKQANLSIETLTPMQVEGYQKALIEISEQVQLTNIHGNEIAGWTCVV